MKWLCAGFLALLAAAHLTGGDEDALALPLSMFRDGPQSWLGYALFVLLLGIAAWHTAALTKAEEVGEAAAAAFAFLLLLLVAATPSLNDLHVFASLLLLALLFANFAVVLYRAESLWLFAHLAVPTGLTLATQSHSYGLWQKSIIVYFVVAAAIRGGMLVPPPKRPPVRIGSRKRRVVYRLEPGPTWRLRGARSDSSLSVS